MASIETQNITSTSFQARAYNLMTAGSIGHYVVWYLDGSRWDSEDLADDDTESGWITFDGLDPDTSYTIEVQNINGEGAIMETKSKTVTTEAGEEVTEWTVSETDSWGYISSEENGSYYLEEYGVVRIRVGFQESGTATFYSEGAISSRAYLSDSTSFDSSNGRPSSYLEYDSNSSGDFSFTCDVESGTYYYLFVRHRYEDESGYIDVYVTPPGSSSVDGWTIAYENGYSNVSETLNLEYELLEGEVARVRVYFAESGTATFYSEGDTDVIAYLSDQDSDDFDLSSGTPNSVLAQDDDGGTNYNFSFTYDVEAGTYYYLYVRHINLETSGTPAVYIVPPESTSSDTWTVESWGTYSNIYTEQTIAGTLDAGTVGMIKFTCKNSGTATFYSTGDLDVRAYLSTSDSFDGTSGEPDVYDASNDDAGSGDRNFSISFDVTAGTTYYLFVRCFNVTDSGSTTVYLNPPSEDYEITGATIVAEGASTTTIEAYVTGLDTSYGRDDRYINWYIGTSSSNMSYYGQQDLSSRASSGDVYTFTNRSAGTTYYIYAVIYYTNNGVYESKTLDTVTAKTTGARPDYFEWDEAKVAGEPFNITASEWCALLDNINAVRVYMGYSAIQTGTTAAYFMYPDAGDEFTAVHYNQALNGITGMLGTGYNDNAVTSGEEITAAKINLLRDWINDIE